MNIKLFTKSELTTMQIGVRLFTAADNTVAKFFPKNDDMFEIVWENPETNEIIKVDDNGKAFEFEYNKFTPTTILIVGKFNDKYITYVNTPTVAERAILDSGYLPPKYTEFTDDKATVKDLHITLNQAKKAIVTHANGTLDTSDVPPENKILKHGMIVTVPADPDNETNRKTIKFRIRMRTKDYWDKNKFYKSVRTKNTNKKK